VVVSWRPAGNKNALASPVNPALSCLRDLEAKMQYDMPNVEESALDSRVVTFDMEVATDIKPAILFGAFRLAGHA
jgi:hypothetical protein